MKVTRGLVSLKVVTFLLAGLAITLPLAAQLELSPEHFDEKPSAARPHKPALPAHKTAKSKPSAGNQDSTAAKTNNKAQAASVLKADATTSSNSR